MLGTNTYLVGTGSKRLLIDTGEGRSSWPPLLSSVLTSERATISECLITHWHPDHVGGISDLIGICPSVTIHKHEPDSNQHNILTGQTFKVEGATLRAFHSPGHTTDHMAFILEEENAMFTGDNVLGHGTAVFEDLATYLSSLQSMEKQFNGRAYPAHGAVIANGRDKIKEYIIHRRQREEEVLSVLREQGVKTSMEIVGIVYKDVPVNLHVPAEGGVLQVLRKLKGEGKVLEEASGRWQVQDKAAL